MKPNVGEIYRSKYHVDVNESLFVKVTKVELFRVELKWLDNGDIYPGYAFEEFGKGKRFEPVNPDNRLLRIYYGFNKN